MMIKIDLNKFTNNYLIIYDKLNEILNKNLKSTKYSKRIIGFFPEKDKEYFKIYWEFEDPQYIGVTYGTDILPFEKLGDLC